MGKFVDLTGKRFGRLVVLYRGRNRPSGKLRWVCQCDCGDMALVATWDLRSGRVVSCGCHRAEAASKRMSAYNELRGRDWGIGVALTKAYRAYVDGARKRGLLFDLTRERFEQISDLPCYYCGMERSKVVVVRDSVYWHNGIDRLDNSKGYIEGNMVPCCKVCNHAKHTMSEEEFMSWLDRFARHQGYGR